MQFFRGTFLKSGFDSKCCKGIETVTNLRISQILSEVLPNNINKKIAVLSGPNISSEIIKNYQVFLLLPQKISKLIDCFKKYFPLIILESTQMMT